MKNIFFLPTLQGLLGACCDCGEADRPVRHVVMISMRSPEPGHGCWGCMTCNLPQAGAIAVLCDQCAKSFNGQPLNIVLGSPDENRRMALADLTEPFDHDQTKHAGHRTELIFGGHAPKHVAELAGLTEKISDKMMARRERHSRN